MTLTDESHACHRCHARAKFLETFKKCLYCSKHHCHQCWTELHDSEENKTLTDALPRVDASTRRRVCASCMKLLAKQRTGHVRQAKQDRVDEDYQLALAMSLSQRDADESLTRTKRKLDDEHEKDMRDRTMNVVALANEIDRNEDLLKQTTEAIERFMNRARSNCKLTAMNNE